MNSDTTKTDALLDLLEVIHETCIDKAPTRLTYDSENMQAPYMFSMYSIVVELAGDSYQAGKSLTAFSSFAIAAGDINAPDRIATTVNRAGTRVQLKFLNTFMLVLFSIDISL